MKSIFLGTNTVFSVYNENSRLFLKENAELEPICYTKEDILSDPEKFSDTEFIFSTWGMPIFTEEEIHKTLPNLKCVFYGAGSVQTFARSFLNCGVKVFSAWAANAVPVAEYTVAQIILANKGFFLASKMTTDVSGRKAAASYFKTMPGNYTSNVGIIGAGMIGKLVIKMLKDYNLNIFVYDPFLSEVKAAELGAKKASLEAIFSSCQVISNHVANLPATVGMFNYELFSLMKDNAVFINTGRGAQVVEDDLIKLLEEKPGITAVLDVTMPEPPVENSKFYSLKNVVLTPHIAGSSGLEVQRMGEFMTDQFAKYINSLPCEYEVTLKMLETMA